MTVKSENARTQTGIDLLICSLPVTDPQRLLECLATAWSEACGCSSLFVSLIVRGEATGLLLQNGQSSLTTASCDGQWSAAGATEWLSELLGDCRELLSSMTVVPFEVSADSASNFADFSRKQSSEVESVGGLLALGADPAPQAARPLVELSARLIQQLRLVAENVDTENVGCEENSRVLRDQKLEALAEFAAGAGHEINNPVATIAGRASLLLRSETDPERRRSLETIGGQAYRVRDMIGDAMTFARPPEPRTEMTAPAQLVQDVAASFEETAKKQGTQLTLKLDETLQISVDPEQFRVVVSCLIRNSLEALKSAGTIQIQLSANESHAVLRVADDGPGLDEIEREHLFDPFFSGRQAGRGLGFGLSKCWQILRQHGGWIDTDESAPGQAESGFAIMAAWPVDR
jgi:signal transduction histidine kinase